MVIKHINIHGYMSIKLKDFSCLFLDVTNKCNVLVCSLDSEVPMSFETPMNNNYF